MIVLQTERLSLRHLTPDDAPFILELVNDPGWIRFIGDRFVRNVDDAGRYIQTAYLGEYARLGFGMYLTELRETGEPMGMCGLIKRDMLEDVDIGFAFLPRYGAQGYALEAAKAVVAHARDVLGLPRILAITTPDNAPSRRLLEKLGMRLDRMLTPKDEPEELCLYAIELTG